jgi:hypothetical protein
MAERQWMPVCKTSTSCAAQLLAWATQEIAADGGPVTLAAGASWTLRAHGLRVLADEGRCSAGELKGFSEGLHEAPWHSTAEYETFTDASAAHAYVDERVPSWSRPTGWRLARVWW